MPHNLDNYNDIFNTSEVKEILGIGSNKVYSLLSTGKIRNFKIGNIRKIPKWCLKKYIDESISDIHNSEKEKTDDSSSED